MKTHFLKLGGYMACSGWKTTLLTSIFFLLTSVLFSPHGTTLMAFADVSRFGFPPPNGLPSIISKRAMWQRFQLQLLLSCHQWQRKHFFSHRHLHYRRRRRAKPLGGRQSFKVLIRCVALGDIVLKAIISGMTAWP